MQLADAPSQMPRVQTQAIVSIMRHLLNGTVFALHDVVKIATDLRAIAQQVTAQDFLSKVTAAFSGTGSEAEAAIAALQSPRPHLPTGVASLFSQALAFQHLAVAWRFHQQNAIVATEVKEVVAGP